MRNVLTFFGLVLVSSAAIAQGPSIQHFRPAMPGQPLVQTHGTQTQKQPFSASFFMNYADQPLEFRNNNGQLNFIEGVFTWDAALTFSLFPRVDLSVAYQYSPLLTPNGALSTLVNDRGLGDMMVRSLIELIEPSQGPFGLAVLPIFVFPTGSDADYLGYPGFGMGAQVALDQSRGRFYHALNVGFMYRTQEAQLANLSIQHQWNITYGASYALETFTLGSELTAITDAGSPFSDAIESPIEISLFAKKQSTASMQWVAGVGKGLTRGYGAPSWRVFAGLTYTPMPKTNTTQTASISESVLTQLTNLLDERAASTQEDSAPSRNQAYFDGKAVHFEQDQTHLMPESTLLLQDLVTWAQQHPQNTIVLVGHTDQTGSDAYNQKLSVARANHVKKFLVIQGLSEDRIEIDGKGSSEPKYQEDSPYQQLLNRRVDIYLP